MGEELSRRRRCHEERKLSAKQGSMKIGGRQGFTLVEAMMACVLLSIVTLLAIPTISGYYAEARLSGLSGKIVWHLRLCRQLAISRRLTHWVVFDVFGNSYALYEEREDAPGRENRVRLTYLTAGVETEVDLREKYPGLTLSAVNIGGQHEVGFNLLGVPLDANGEELAEGGEVIIEDRAGRQKTVSIASQTGKAFLE